MKVCKGCWTKSICNHIQVCLDYRTGELPPNYPAPAIPLSVHWPDTGYIGMVYIDDDRNPDDPIMVYQWDEWSKEMQEAADAIAMLITMEPVGHC